LLQRLLYRWSRQGCRFGIPQTNDASSFFSTIYLDELDKWMGRHGHEYLRYVDDIRVFSDSEPSARKALAELIVELRGMGMYVASAKTGIRKTDLVLREMEGDRSRLRVIDEELESGVQERLEKAAAILETLYLELVSDPGRFNDRHFRFCVNRFKKLGVSDLGGGIHRRVVEEVLSRLVSMPQSTGVFADYLSVFPDDESIHHSVLDFLEGAYNIYPWQEMNLLELLLRSNIGPGLVDRALDFARCAAGNMSRHPACRAKAFLLWGRYGDYADRREIRDAHYDEPREDIRRAILVSIQEMQRGERNTFFDRVSRGSRALQSTVDYIRSLNNPTYHYYNPPSAYDVVESDEDSDDLDDLDSEDFLY
jgi:hypothetical protein